MTLKTLAAATALAAIIAAPAFAQQGGGGGRPQMTPEERAAAWVNADANKDGKLDPAEFKVSLGERAAQIPEDMLGQIFGRRDADKDGFISKAEYDAPPPARPAQ